MPEDQPTFIGLTNTLLAPVVFLAPILGGRLADAGFEALFALMIVCGFAGGALLFAWGERAASVAGCANQRQAQAVGARFRNGC